MSVKCSRCGCNSVDVCMKDTPYAPLQTFSCRCLHCNSKWSSMTIDPSIFKCFKVWVPIVDSNGRQVDSYREDWHENNSPEAAAEQGYLMACEYTWGENNEFRPTRNGIEVECVE